MSCFSQEEQRPTENMGSYQTEPATNAINNIKPLLCSEEELKQMASIFQTPFQLYDKESILKGARIFNESFAWTRSLTGMSFKNHFAIKATPTPKILKILNEECGMGMDCCSLGELLLCEKLGIKGEDIIFTSNDTQFEEYRKAFELGAIINLDDFSQIDNLKKALGGIMPEIVSFRFNPGPYCTLPSNEVIGNPAQAKFGLTKVQLFSAYRKCKEYGVKRFGLHTMVKCYCLDVLELAKISRMMFQLAVEIYQQTGVSLEFVDMGGGIGVKYRPEQQTVNLGDLGNRVKDLYEEIVLPCHGLHPLQIKYECGALVTAEHGCLISRVINMKDTYKRFLGLDSSMADLILQGECEDYRDITIVKDQSFPSHVRKNLPDYKTVIEDPSYASPLFEGNKRERMFDVVGSICMNKDKFAIDQVLNVNPQIGDLCIIHDTGAYGGSSMAFNFNAKLQHAEILRVAPSRYEMIRRPQTYDDHFATMIFP